MAQPGTDAELRRLLFSIAYRARRHLEARKPRFEPTGGASGSWPSGSWPSISQQHNAAPARRTGGPESPS